MVSVEELGDRMHQRHEELMKSGKFENYQADAQVKKEFASEIKNIGKPEPEPKVVVKSEPITSLDEGYAIEHEKIAPQGKFQPQSMSEKIFGRKITTDEIENLAGKGIGKVQEVAERPLKRMKEIREENIELKKIYDDAYRKARTEAAISHARSAGRTAGGFGGYSVARPVKIKVVTVMKPPKTRMMTDSDMGMSLEAVGDPVGRIPSGSDPVGFRLYERRPVGEIRSKEPVGRIPRTGRNPEVHAQRVYDPVGNISNVGGRSPVNINLGAVRSPVNVNVAGGVSTRTSRGTKPETRFRGRKPRTEIQTEKQFWEL